MPRQVKIRKNNVIGLWEHWIDTNDNTGYWANTIYNSTVPMSTIVASQYTNVDELGTILLYEDFNNDWYSLTPSIITYDTADLLKYVETEIYELIITDNTGSIIYPPIIPPVIDPTGSEEEIIPGEIGPCQYPPNVKNIYDVHKPTKVNSLIGDFPCIVSSSFLLVASASNPCTGTSLNQYWFDNGKQKNKRSERELELTYSEYDIKKEKENHLITCQAKNLVGTTISSPLSITIYNPWESKYFGRNLLKNGDGRDGFNNWSIINGAPKIYPGWSIFNKVGFFNAQTAISNSPRSNYSESYLSYDKMFPTIDEIKYFQGGEMLPDNSLVSMYQLIDISPIADYIDGKIDGAGIPYLRYFGLFGKWGTSSKYPGSMFWYTPGYMLPGLDSPLGHYYPLAINHTVAPDGNVIPINNAPTSFFSSCPENYYIGDRVKMRVYFLNDVGTILYEPEPLRTNNFIGQYEKIWLRNKVSIIPIGTRTIKVELLFEKDFDIHVSSPPFDTLPTEQQQAMQAIIDQNGYPMSELDHVIAPETMWNVRQWENKDSNFDFHLDHLACASLLHCEICLDGRIDPHYNMPLSPPQIESSVRSSIPPTATRSDGRELTTIFPPMFPAEEEIYDRPGIFAGLLDSDQNYVTPPTLPPPPPTGEEFKMVPPYYFHVPRNP